ncbi:hypothetical protein [Clostridium sp.]|uniref:hypothetical protein n=1 Tax=Clostridium sp. TaxID=1506 RepID=UPI0035A058FE
MKVSDIIYILLFILPGVIAEKISYYFDMPDDKKQSEFGNIVNGILLSFPIILVTFVIIYFIYGFTNIQEYIKVFNEVRYLFLFVPLILFISILIGILKGLISELIINKVNEFREKHNKIKIDNKSCWRKTFLDDPTNHYLKVKVDGEEYEGFVQYYSLPNESKSIVIYIPEELDDYPEYKDYIKKVRRTYIDLEKNIVIKDYDIKEYSKYCEKLINKK